MKMIYNCTPIKSLNIKHYEVSTNDATLRASDLQSGITAYAKGKKVIGTGKAFSFAMYGDCVTGRSIPLPTSEINTFVIGANECAIKMANTTLGFRNTDFSIPQEIATAIIDGADYSVTLKIVNNMLTIACSQSLTLQVMFGKDDYV